MIRTVQRHSEIVFVDDREVGKLSKFYDDHTWYFQPNVGSVDPNRLIGGSMVWSPRTCKAKVLNDIEYAVHSQRRDVANTIRDRYKRVYHNPEGC